VDSSTDLSADAAAAAAAAAAVKRDSSSVGTGSTQSPFYQTSAVRFTHFALSEELQHMQACPSNAYTYTKVCVLL